MAGERNGSRVVLLPEVVVGPASVALLDVQWLGLGVQVCFLVIFEGLIHSTSKMQGLRVWFEGFVWVSCLWGSIWRVCILTGKMFIGCNCIADGKLICFLYDTWGKSSWASVVIWGKSSGRIAKEHHVALSLNGSDHVRKEKEDKERCNKFFSQQV